MNKKNLLILMAVLLIPFATGIKNASAAAASGAVTSGGTITVNGNTVTMYLSTSVSALYAVNDSLAGLTTNGNLITCHVTGNRIYGLDSDGGGVLGAFKTNATNCTDGDFAAVSAVSGNDFGVNFTAAIAATDT